MAPSIYYNNQGEGYKFVPVEKQSYEMNTIGNLGYSSVQCQQIPVVVGKLSLSCPYGMIGEFYDYGINHHEDGGRADSCLTTDANQGCKPNSEAFEAILQSAIGKAQFNTEFSIDDLFTGDGDYAICSSVDTHPHMFT